MDHGPPVIVLVSFARLGEEWSTIKKRVIDGKCNRWEVHHNSFPPLSEECITAHFLLPRTIYSHQLFKLLSFVLVSFARLVEPAHYQILMLHVSNENHRILLKEINFQEDP